MQMSAHQDAHEGQHGWVGRYSSNSRRLLWGSHVLQTASGNCIGIDGGLVSGPELNLQSRLPVEIGASWMPEAFSLLILDVFVRTSGASVLRCKGFVARHDRPVLSPFLSVTGASPHESVCVDSGLKACYCSLAYCTSCNRYFAGRSQALLHATFSVTQRRIDWIDAGCRARGRGSPMATWHSNSSMAETA